MNPEIIFDNYEESMRAFAAFARLAPLRQESEKGMAADAVGAIAAAPAFAGQPIVSLWNDFATEQSRLREMREKVESDGRAEVESSDALFDSRIADVDTAFKRNRFFYDPRNIFVAADALVTSTVEVPQGVSLEELEKEAAEAAKQFAADSTTYQYDEGIK